MAVRNVEERTMHAGVSSETVGVLPLKLSGYSRMPALTSSDPSAKLGSPLASVLRPATGGLGGGGTVEQAGR